jgi:redox-sensing transcriptional repressor
MPSKHTIKRLVIYNRVLKDLDRKGDIWITSEKIAEIISRHPAQVRKDLSSLGRKGKPGVGYNIKNMIDDIDSVLGLKSEWGVVIIGAGNLGRALCYYPGFKRQGFEFRMIVDNDPKKIGKKWGGITISPLRNLKQTIKKLDINIALISVPEAAAQAVADKVVEAGIKEILNFAPATLIVPDDVNISYADLALELENLSYHLSRRKEK